MWIHFLYGFKKSHIHNILTAFKGGWDLIVSKTYHKKVSILLQLGIHNNPLETSIVGLSCVTLISAAVLILFFVQLLVLMLSQCWQFMLPILVDNRTCKMCKEHPQEDTLFETQPLLKCKNGKLIHEFINWLEMNIEGCWLLTSWPHPCLWILSILRVAIEKIPWFFFLTWVLPSAFHNRSQSETGIFLKIKLTNLTRVKSAKLTHSRSTVHLS